jgi:hypothetical protein
LDEIKIKDNLTFTLYGAVGGTATISGVVISRLSADGVPNTASAPSDHVNLYRDLPQEIKDTIEDDWTSYNYLSIKTNTGVVYIGEPWIVLGTLFRDDIGTATVTLLNFRDSDATPLRLLLEANGYVVSKIKIT